MNASKHALTRALNERGWSMATAAEALGVSTAYVRHSAYGRARPSDRVAEGLAGLLGTTADEVRALLPLADGETPFQPCDEARRALRRAGVTGTELARRSGLHLNYVLDMLAGRRRPTGTVMAAVEDATGRPREVLFPHASREGQPGGE